MASLTSPPPVDDPASVPDLLSDFSAAVSGPSQPTTSLPDKTSLTMIKTLKPYSMSSNGHVTRSSNFDDLFGPNTWTIFFNFKLDHDDFALRHALRSSVGYVDIRRLPPGDRLLEVRNEKRSLVLQDWIASPTSSITVSQSDKINNCISTVIIHDDIRSSFLPFTNYALLIKTSLATS